MTVSSDLLARAASCYARAGWNHEACRCYEQTGHHAEAARLYESMELWPAAANAYVLAGAWSSAARCYLRAGDPASAAENLLKADEHLEAGWVLAERLHRFRRARAVVEPIKTTQTHFSAPAQYHPLHPMEGTYDRSSYEVADPSAAAARDLVLARCDAGDGQSKPAAKRLRQVIQGFGELDPGPGRQRVEEWAAAVATSLGRPDLVSRLYAAANGAEIPGAAERWEAWAVERLGDATGVPMESASGATVPMNEGEEDGEREAALQDPPPGT